MCFNCFLYIAWHHFQRVVHIHPNDRYAQYTLHRLPVSGSNTGVKHLFSTRVAFAHSFV